MADLYDRIKERRKELQLSQDDLAKRLGYKSRSSINKIEKGINDIPQSKIVEIAKALQTTPEWLMGWSNKVTGNSGGVLIELGEHGIAARHKIRPKNAQISDLLQNIPEVAQIELLSILQDAPALFKKNLEYIFQSSNDKLYEELCDSGHFTYSDIRAFVSPNLSSPNITPTDKMLRDLSDLTGYSIAELVFSDLEEKAKEQDAHKLDYDIQQLVDMCKQLPPNVLNHVLEFTEERFRENIGPAPNDL